MSEWIDIEFDTPDLTDAQIEEFLNLVPTGTGKHFVITTAPEIYKESE